MTTEQIEGCIILESHLDMICLGVFLGMATFIWVPLGIIFFNILPIHGALSFLIAIFLACLIGIGLAYKWTKKLSG